MGVPLVLHKMQVVWYKAVDLMEIGLLGEDGNCMLT
jgi:hypothetical protein